MIDARAVDSCDENVCSAGADDDARATFFREGEFHGQYGSDYDGCVFEYHGEPVEDGHCLSDTEVADLLEKGILVEADTSLRS